MTLLVSDLNDFGRARMEDDFAACDRRGKRGAIADFSEGWMAAMVRIKQWSFFTAEARARIEAEQ